MNHLKCKREGGREGDEREGTGEGRGGTGREGEREGEREEEREKFLVGFTLLSPLKDEAPAECFLGVPLPLPPHYPFPLLLLPLLTRQQRRRWQVWWKQLCWMYHSMSLLLSLVLVILLDMIPIFITFVFSFLSLFVLFTYVIAIRLLEW